MEETSYVAALQATNGHYLTVDAVQCNNSNNEYGKEITLTYYLPRHFFVSNFSQNLYKNPPDVPINEHTFVV